MWRGTVGSVTWKSGAEEICRQGLVGGLEIVREVDREQVAPGPTKALPASRLPDRPSASVTTDFIAVICSPFRMNKSSFTPLAGVPE